MLYVVVFITGFLLSGIWFALNMLLSLKAKNSKLLLMFSPLLSAVVPAVMIWLLMGDHPFHFEKLADHKVWIAAAVTLAAVCTVVLAGPRNRKADTSAELARLAKENFGIKVTVCNMANWRANHPYDGIWCCASLLHLSDDEIQAFFRNLQGNLTSSGTFFLSVKTGIETGYDNKGRYMRNFTECELRKLIKTAGLIIREYWLTEDKLNRSGFRWINVIAACDPAG